MLNTESILALDTIRTTTQDVFDDQKLSAKRVIEVRVNVTPARLLSFQYYGDSSRGEEIAKLNKEINVSYMEGNIKVLTA